MAITRCIVVELKIRRAPHLHISQRAALKENEMSPFDPTYCYVDGGSGDVS